MSYNLFLDDYRVPYDVTWSSINMQDSEWVVVRSYEEFIKCITFNGVPHFISYDHDLTENHYIKNYSDGKTGADCALWLKGFCLRNSAPMPQYQVHSLNEEAEGRIGYYYL